MTETVLAISIAVPLGITIAGIFWFLIERDIRNTPTIILYCDGSWEIEK